MKCILSCLILFATLISKGQEVEILLSNKIKLRDGISLNATIYKPKKQQEALPVIFALTPYNADRLHARGKYFAEENYVFVIIDARGRGNSEGVFDPFMQEANDGYDIVEFLAKQKYCNGKVAMWGASYLGYNQWATVKELPPHLKTIVPVASAKTGVDFPGMFNISDPWLLQWLGATSEKSFNLNLFGDDEYWMNIFSERYMKDLPFASLDSLTGKRNEIFQKWMAHPFKDEYLKSMAPTQLQYSKINLPILSITGCYDGDQHGTLSYYKEFMQYANNEAKKNFYLIIGPWDHTGTVNPSKEIGGLVFGDSCLLDMNDIHRQWYNYTLLDSAKPIFLKNSVAYFISNKNKWKYVNQLSEIGKEKQSFYLNAPISNTVSNINPGLLQNTLPTNKKPLEYVYNPLDKTNGILEMIPSEEEEMDNGLSDTSLSHIINGKGLIYETLPFINETEVSGFFELKAYIETDVKDIDIKVDVFEIRLDGSGVFLTSNTVRARYRESQEVEKLLIPGEINLFHFNKFTFISRSIEKGSRIRLIIHSPNVILTQKNYCSGGVVAKETAKDAKTAHVKIYNDKKHPSVLIMPIVKD
ncbi:MAG: CocE/NonD family hydrolase [Bacteroidetes bacterium]|nr:CocE/NonD family hydrolase [Bacteroidota bacterium]